MPPNTVARCLSKRMMEFKSIQEAFWDRCLWAREYFVASSDNVRMKLFRSTSAFGKREILQTAAPNVSKYF